MRVSLVFMFLATLLISCGQGEVQVKNPSNSNGVQTTGPSGSDSEISTASGSFRVVTKDAVDPYYGSSYSYTGYIHSECENSGYDAFCVYFDSNNCGANFGCTPNYQRETFMNNCSLNKLTRPYSHYSVGQCTNN